MVYFQAKILIGVNFGGLAMDDVGIFNEWPFGTFCSNIVYVVDGTLFFLFWFFKSP
jgi:hypothetical protein